MSCSKENRSSTERFSQTVDRVKSELDRFVELAWSRGEEVIQQFRSPDSEGDWNPEIDLVETETSLLVFANLPGIPADHVRLSIAGNTLEMTAEHESLTLQASDKVHRRERPSGTVSRILTLPVAVKNDSAVAHAENGVFKIELQKLEHLQPRTIPVVDLDETPETSGENEES